jgi:hypothetical protein
MINQNILGYVVLNEKQEDQNISDIGDVIKKEEFFENSLTKNEHDEENNSYFKKQEEK